MTRAHKGITCTLLECETKQSSVGTITEHDLETKHSEGLKDNTHRCFQFSQSQHEDLSAFSEASYKDWGIADAISAGDCSCSEVILQRNVRMLLYF